MVHFEVKQVKTDQLKEMLVDLGKNDCQVLACFPPSTERSQRGPQRRGTYRR